MTKQTNEGPYFEVGIRSGQVVLSIWSEGRVELLADIIFGNETGPKTAKWIGQELVRYAEIAEGLSQ